MKYPNKFLTNNAHKDIAARSQGAAYTDTLNVADSLRKDTAIQPSPV
jgi:hypothetical protein